MTITIATAEERRPSIGQFRVITRTYGEKNKLLSTVRGDILRPGQFDATGQWVETDLSGQPESIQQIAAEMWTPAVIAECKALRPFVPVPEPEPEASPVEKLASFLQQNPDVAALINPGD